MIQRTIEPELLDRFGSKDENKKVVIIYGARQVGKTTLVKSLLKTLTLRSAYYNCDYLDVQSMFSWESAGNYNQLVKNLDLLVLDEAQRIKNIGMVLKILHDEFPHLQVVATGSSSFELANQVNEPLTGRKIIYKLFPFSFKELFSRTSFIEQKRNLPRVLRFGLYPPVILGDDKQATENLNEITASYLFKDILEFQQLKKPEILIDLLKLLAFQISHEVSYTELAGKLQVDQTVIQRYIQLLEDNFVIFRLPAFKRNSRNEIGKSRKIYFWDVGIRNALIQQLNPMDLRNDQGALWENFCISERMKMLNYERVSNVNSFFWRTYAQKEIDYIEERDSVLKAFEFKWTEKKKLKPPAEFSKSYPGVNFAVITPNNFTDWIS